MRGYITLGSTPCDEECAQTIQDDYIEKSYLEAKAYVAQIHRHMKENGKELLPGMKLAVKSFPHDFGSYQEVVIYYDTDNEDQTELAFWLEGNTPMNWDNESNLELNKSEMVAHKGAHAIGISFEHSMSFSRTLDKDMSKDEVIQFMKNEFGGEGLDQIIIATNKDLITYTEQDF